MTTRQFSGSNLSRGLARKSSVHNEAAKGTRRFSLGCPSEVVKGLGRRDVASNCCLSADYRKFLSPSVTRRKKPRLGVAFNQLSSGYGVESANVEERSSLEEEYSLINSRDEHL